MINGNENGWRRYAASFIALMMIGSFVFLTTIPFIPQKENDEPIQPEETVIAEEPTPTEEPSIVMEKIVMEEKFASPSPTSIQKAELVKEPIDDEEYEFKFIDPPEEEVVEIDYEEFIPLANSVVEALIEACDEHGVPLHIGLGLIDLESEFVSSAVSKSGCYGLCQLHPKYFPSNLSDEDNVRYGMEYLGSHYKNYGDWSKALNAYNKGHYTGDIVYPNEVLSRAEKWKKILNEHGIEI